MKDLGIAGRLRFQWSSLRSGGDAPQEGGGRVSFVMEERRPDPKTGVSAAGWLREARRHDQNAVMRLERAVRA